MPDEAKKGPQPFQEGFRLHYFPNIPLDKPLNRCARRTRNSDFERSLFKDMDPDPSRPTDDAGEQIPERQKEAKGPSVDEIKEAAFQKGFLEGKKIGLESGVKKADPVIESLGQVLAQLANLRQEIYQEIEKEVTQLALSIARKIVCHEVETTRETVACVAQEALRQVDNPGKIKIKLNPADLQFIKDTRNQLSHYLDNVDKIRFEAEESIQSGGCLIETDRGDIDARIEKQFQAIEESFRTHFVQPQQESE